MRTERKPSWCRWPTFRPTDRWPRKLIIDKLSVEIMNCIGCSAREGPATKVEYTDGSEEMIQLCELCQHEFSEGVFVADVAPPDQDSPTRSFTPIHGQH